MPRIGQPSVEAPFFWCSDREAWWQYVSRSKNIKIRYEAAGTAIYVKEKWMILCLLLQILMILLIVKASVAQWTC